MLTIQKNSILIFVTDILPKKLRNQILQLFRDNWLYIVNYSDVFPIFTFRTA